MPLERSTRQWYITSSSVLSLKNIFHVPKGGSDISLVYDVTACGLNEDLWDTNLCIPSVKIIILYNTFINIT